MHVYVVVCDCDKFIDSFLAFFYRIEESDGEEIENIVRHLADLDEMNDNVELSYTFSLWSLIGNINTERFYMYRGL
jgi:Eukaryotic-type carbonic anhydrase